jgi:hypothetical protein
MVVMNRISETWTDARHWGDGHRTRHPLVAMAETLTMPGVVMVRDVEGGQ